MKKIFTVAIAAILLPACNGTEKLAGDNKVNARKSKVACADLHVDIGTNHLDWIKQKPSVLQDDTKVVVLPKVYDVYSIDIAQMNSFFQAAKSNTTEQPLKTAVPLPYGCVVFAVAEQTDVPKEMKVRYPNTVLIKGEQDGYMLNMAFDGVKMSGQAKSATQHFNIMPIEANGAYYYIVYEKAQEMEANKNGVYNGPQKMKSLKVRYDR